MHIIILDILSINQIKVYYKMNEITLLWAKIRMQNKKKTNTFSYIIFSYLLTFFQGMTL